MTADVEPHLAEDIWGNASLSEAIRLMQAGEYEQVAVLAKGAEVTAREQAMTISHSFVQGTKTSGRLMSPWSKGRRSGDFWTQTMDDLAMSLEAKGNGEHAETLYMRMLAWQEGVDQYWQRRLKVSKLLFEKSPGFRTVEDATWFLKKLRPTDGHASREVVALLALGEELAAKAAVGVWTMSLRASQRPQLAESGALELLVKVISYYPTNAELQAAGCGALRLLCTGNPLVQRNRQNLVNTFNGVEAVVEALKHHPSDPEVQREGCGLLRAVATKHPSGARRVLQNDGIQLCLEAIANCSSEAVGDVAVKAIRALSCAVLEQMGEPPFAGFEAEQWQDKLLEARADGQHFAIQKLRELMPEGNRIVLQALLAAAAEFLEDVDVRERSLGLIDVVICCMGQFPGHLKVQAAGSAILWRLTEGHSGAETAVQTVAQIGGLVALVQAMRDLPLQEEVQLMAVGAIRNVVHGQDSRKTLGVRAGGIPVAVTAMQRNPKNAVLQELAIGALTSMCDTLGRATVLVKLGGVEATVGALRRHSAVTRVVESACIMLCMLCEDPQLRQRIDLAGAGPIAQAISRSSHSEQQKWGFELLRCLSDSGAA